MFYRFDERLVLALFVTLVFLWLFREPKIIPGWSALFPQRFFSCIIMATWLPLGCSECNNFRNFQGDLWMGPFAVLIFSISLLPYYRPFIVSDSYWYQGAALNSLKGDLERFCKESRLITKTGTGKIFLGESKFEGTSCTVGWCACVKCHRSCSVINTVV